MRSLLKNILPNTKERIEGLDLMRSIAILCVVFYHAWAFLLPYFKNSGSLFFLGFWGVELFFILSGFLVGGIFIKQYQNTKSINFDFLFNFWKRRWKRTIPIYVIILFINYLFASFYLNDSITFPFRYLFFSQNLWTVHPNFFPESWSLCVEEWFYLSLPLLFIPFSFINKSRSSGGIILYLLSIVVAYAFIRFNNIPEVFNLPNWDYGLRKIVLYRLDAILYGVLFYVIINRNFSFFKSFRYYFLFLGLAIVLLSYYIFFLKTFVVYNTVFFTSISGIGMSFCLPFFIHFQFKFTGFKNLITLISVISYSMYLIHYTLVYRFIDYNFQSQNLSEAAALFIVYIAVVLVVSVLVYKNIERLVSVQQIRNKAVTTGGTT